MQENKTTKRGDRTKSIFTPRQVENWKLYEGVRKSGLLNMFDPQAREMTGLNRDEYLFVMKNYSELKQAQQEAR